MYSECVCIHRSVCIYVCVYIVCIYIVVMHYFQWRWTLLSKFSSFWNYLWTELCLGLIPLTYTEGGFKNSLLKLIIGFPKWWSSEESTRQRRRHRRCGFDPWVRKIAWSRKWQLTPVFLPGKFHVRRSLAGYSPWSHEESDTTKHKTRYGSCYWGRWLSVVWWGGEGGKEDLVSLTVIQFLWTGLFVSSGYYE